MKKNTVLYIVLFVALAVVATVLVLKRSESTLPKALTDFAVEDTSQVTHIHLTDHFKNDITLERKGPGWWRVNNKYDVKQRAMETLLETIKEVKVKNPIPGPSRDNVIKDLAVNGIMIEIYKGADLVKCYFVGSSTANDEGTLMMIKGSSEPYVTEIPGFVGYLTTRYITKEQEWRSSAIYHLNPSEITEIQVKYMGNPAESFKLNVQDNQYMVSGVDGAKPAVKMNQLLAKKYLVGYKAINFEVFPQLSQGEKDSILLQPPYATLNVTTTQGKQPTLKLYPKPADIKTKDINKDNMDMNRFYATIGDNSKEIVMVQTYVIGRLMATYNDLATGKGVKLPNGQDM